jgi:restriction system protein
VASSYWVRQQRERERQRLRAERAYRAQLRGQARAQREYERQQVYEAKERQRLYVELCVADVADMNRDLAERIEALEGLLAATLPLDDHIDFDELKEQPDLPEFDPGSLAHPGTPPVFDPPPAPGWLGRLMPGAQRKHEEATKAATAGHALTFEAFTQSESARVAELEAARRRHEQSVETIRQQAAEQHATVDAFKAAFDAGNPEAIVNYFGMVLAASRYPEGFPQEHKIAFVPESRQLVVEYDLPDFDIVPVVREYRYVKSKDETAESARPMTQRKALYSSVVAQVVLRTIHELFEADRDGHVESVVLNAHVNTVDRRTGQAARPCLATVRTNKDAFDGLDLARVDPIACLRGLNAAVSKSPSELVPVRPVLEFNMVDSRFVDETDVLSGLDQRPNLMELSPSEFEALITNLFEKMGLETKLTQASRDGGVDCVAYDPRPILGGKVVIQAKRYKNTVGVSAVRDLFGTMQNEGASKGILVTTSGYGKASFEFADGKPLELLGGSNLLYLLEQNAGIEAKIEPPEDWVDPEPQQ